MAAFSAVGEGSAKAKPMAKHVKRLHLVYMEDSFRERLGCARGGFNLMEDIVATTGRPTEYPETNRDMFNAFSNTTKGNVVGGVAWHPWAKSWQAPVATKRLIFGAANRIDVGGPTLEGTKRDPPKPTDLEPVFYHSLCSRSIPRSSSASSRSPPASISAPAKATWPSPSPRPTSRTRACVSRRSTMTGWHTIQPRSSSFAGSRRWPAL